MDGQILSSAIDSSVAEMANMNTANENTEVSVPEKNIGRKNLKKKTASIKQKILEKTTEQKTEGNSRQSADDENINKNSKRKADSVECSENNTEQETEGNEGVGDTYASNFESNKNNSGINLKRKLSKKDENKNLSAKKITDDSSTVDKNATTVKENKNDSSNKSAGRNAIHPPISEMVLDSFRALKKRNGTSVEEISEYIEENFQVNINRIKPYIKKFLQKGVTDGFFDQVNGSRGDGKFKIKKSIKVNNEAKKSRAVRVHKKRREVTKVATKAKKETGKVKKVAAKPKKETGKIARKAKNDEVLPKKRAGA